MKRQMGRRGRIWLLVLALAALLCACGQTAGSDAAPGSPAAAPEETPPMSAEQKKVVAEIESDAASMGQAPGPEDYSWQTLEQQPQADGLLVTASIYTLLLPEDWQDHCVAEETGQWLSLYSKENQDAGYGGLLCSIGWTDDPESYAGIPGCQLLGRVTIDGVTYDVVADVIDDPQAPASGQLREQYLAMQQELPSVFQSLQFGDGVVYTPAA